MATQTKSDPITDSVRGRRRASWPTFSEKTAAAEQGGQRGVSVVIREAVVDAGRHVRDRPPAPVKIEWVAGIGSLQADATRQFVRDLHTQHGSLRAKCGLPLA